MEYRAMRIGDYIDDRCSRCKRITDHSVVSMVGDEVAKVICRTCNSEHKFRGPKAKKEMTKQEAFDAVLARMSAQLGGAQAPSGSVSRKKKKNS